MSDIYRTRHDWETDVPISTSIIGAVAAVTGDEPSDVEPLYTVVDPDALDGLVASFEGGEGGTVQFALNGCVVTVESTGTIELELPE